MKKRGRGICVTHYPTGLTCGGDPSQAILRLKSDGTANLLIGTVDLGQGAKTVFAQMVAEELGIPLESIAVTNSDSDTTPICTGSFASRATYMTGRAVVAACQEVKQVLKEIASGELGVPVESLEVKDGKVLVRDFPEQAIPIADLTAKADWVLGRLVAGRGAYVKSPTAPDPETGRCDPYDTYEYATCIADVEVDTETGQVDVLKMVLAYDMGRAINPLLVEGQIEGGASMGLGYAIMENLTPNYPSVYGQPTSYRDYLIPTAVDVPELVPVIVEKPCPIGPFGAKGLGEFTANSEAPAIVNAIYDAVGVHITDLPATPEKVLKALQAKEAAEAKA